MKYCYFHLGLESATRHAVVKMYFFYSIVNTQCLAFILDACVSGMLAQVLKKSPYKPGPQTTQTAQKNSINLADGIDFEMIACVEPHIGSSGMWQYGGLVCGSNACVVVHVAVSENAQTKKTFYENEKLHIAVHKAIFDPIQKCLVAERVHGVVSTADISDISDIADTANTDKQTKQFISTDTNTNTSAVKRTRQNL